MSSRSELLPWLATLDLSGREEPSAHSEATAQPSRFPVQLVWVRKYFAKRWWGVFRDLSLGFSDKQAVRQGFECKVFMREVKEAQIG